MIEGRFIRSVTKVINQQQNMQHDRDVCQGVTITQYLPLVDLSNYDLSCVMEFLTTGEIIRFAMTCSQAYDNVSEVIKERYPKVINEPWSIAKAIQQSKLIIINTLQDLENFKSLVEEDYYKRRVVSIKLTHAIKRSRDQSVDTNRSPLASFKDYIRVFKHPFKNGQFETEAISENMRRSLYNFNNKNQSGIIPREVIKLHWSIGCMVTSLTISSIGKDDEELLYLLRYFKNLEALVIEDTYYSVNDSNMYTFSMPIFDKLKKLHLCAFDHTTLYYLLHLAPNLEDLKYTYLSAPHDELLDFLGEHNTKLKKLYIDDENGDTPYEVYFTDNGVLRFMSKVKIEEIVFKKCCNITGELFTKIGDYASELKECSIELKSYAAEMPNQYEPLVFGGAVLQNLQRLELAGNWIDLEDEFVDSFIAHAPNIKVLVLNNFYYAISQQNMTKLINAFNLEELFLPSFGQKRPSAKRQRQNYHANLDSNVGMIQAVSQQKNLRHLSMESDDDEPYITTEQLMNCYWPRLTSLEIAVLDDYEWLKALCKACPNLIEINIKEDKSARKEEKSTFAQFVEDETHWPSLLVVVMNATKLADIKRSFLVATRDLMYDLYLQRRRHKSKELSADDFIKEWIKGDYFKKDLYDK
jgi:hypothetical protein